MIVSFIGPREPGNHFKRKIAEYFGVPVFTFDELSAQLFESTNKIYGVPATTIGMQEQLRLLIRSSFTDICPKLYMDWMSNELVTKIFARKENSYKEIQAIILDVETEWEYKVLKDYLMLNRKMHYGSQRRINKVILVENDSHKHLYYNKNLPDYTSFDVDAVISEEDENIEEMVKDLKRSWKVT